MWNRFMKQPNSLKDRSEYQVCFWVDVLDIPYFSDQHKVLVLMMMMISLYKKEGKTALTFL